MRADFGAGRAILRAMHAASQGMPRTTRFRPRLTRRQRAIAFAVLIPAAVMPLVLWSFVSWGMLSVPIAAGGSLAGVVACGLIAYGVRGGFEAMREPRAYRQALARMEAGDRAGALAAVDEALKTAPEAFSPWTLKGLLLAESGDFEGSLAAYREAVSRRPDGWIGHSGAGAALLNLGKPTEAIEELGKALALGAIWPVPRYQLGLALFLRGEYAGAAEALGEALALGLEAPNVELVARSLRAWALEQTGSMEGAREEKARARALEALPEIAGYRQRLAGANLSVVGKLAAWAVGADTAVDPPKLQMERS